MDEETDNQTINNKPWLWKKGQSGNLAGRPKGFSLKEWTRERLAKMTDEQRDAFLEGIPKAEVWKMSEGNPANATDITSAGKPIVMLAAEITEKNDLQTNEEV